MRIKVLCKKCKKEFLVYPCQIKVGEGKYCSHRCADLAHRTVDRNRKCKICGKLISFKNKPTYCVKHSQLGERAPNWQGGKTRETKLLRNRLLASGWAKKIFQRDEWTCVLCGHHGGKLHAHHILSFKEYPEDREKIENGITLCEICHKKIHYGVEDDRITSVVGAKASNRRPISISA